LAAAAAPVTPPPVIRDEEEFEEGGGPERPLWPWLVAIGFVIAAVIAGFFVWNELTGAPQVPVNNYVGETQSAAVQQIRAAGLVPAVDKATNASVDQGKVFKQDPTAGSKIDKGGTVTITVSTGPKKVSVPTVKGEQWSEAQQTLVNAGFKPQKFSVPGDTAGLVTATDPPAGTSLAVGSKIRVNVMSGPAMAPVPSVVGLSIQEAT